MTASKLDQAVRQKERELEVLPKATQDILNDIRMKDRRFRIFMNICVVIILLLVGVGLVYQNKLATQSKDHLDCIVKMFTTPAKPGQSRHIVNLQKCQIKVN